MSPDPADVDAAEREARDTLPRFLRSLCPTAPWIDCVRVAGVLIDRSLTGDRRAATVTMLALAEHLPVEQAMAGDGCVVEAGAAFASLLRLTGVVGHTEREQVQ